MTITEDDDGKLTEVRGVRIKKSTYDALWDMLEDTAARVPKITKSFLDFAEKPTNPMKDRVLAFNAGKEFMAMFAASCAKNGKQDPFTLDYDEIAAAGRRAHGDKFIQWLKDYSDGKIPADPPAAIGQMSRSEEVPLEDPLESNTGSPIEVEAHALSDAREDPESESDEPS